MTDNEILEQAARKIALGLDDDTSLSNTGSIDDIMRAAAWEQEKEKIESGLLGHFENEDVLGLDEVDNILFGNSQEEEQEESAESNIETIEDNETEPVVVEDTEEVKQFKADKEEVARLKEEALEAKRQAAEDQALLQKAMQALLEQQNQMLSSKEKQVEVEQPVKQNNEDLKKKSKAVSEKLMNAEDTAGDDLADLINEAVNSNRQTPITADEITKLVEQSLQKKEIEKYNANFQKINDEFFAKNKDFIEDATNLKLLSSNFNAIQNQYKNKGVLPNPEDLFNQAMSVTQSDIEKYTGKKVVQKNTEVKVSESLKDEANRSAAAKNATPKTQTAATVAKPTQAAKFDPMEEYRKLQSALGVKTKF